MPRRPRTRTAPSEVVTIKGMVRIELRDVRGPYKGRVRRRIIPNAITAGGFQSYIVGAVGAVAGSKQASHLQLATQTTTPSSSQTSASGEFEARKTLTPSFISPGTLRMVASWATNEATQSNLGGIAVYNTSSGGTAASVATYATSSKTTDQTLSVTYEYRFA